MKKTVCFGEIMYRLSPPGYTRFCQTQTLEATFGGGEANVSVSLANFGCDSVYVTKLPNNPIGDGAVNELRRYGVDVSHIARGGDRVGIYYLEKGASQRASKVVYDRKGSSISMAEKVDFDWERILTGADWFHFTGITPAISDSAADITMDACMFAKKMGLTVSCDLNYRKNLWKTDKAGEVMGALMPYTDLCIANEEDAGDVFGIHAKESDVSGGALSREGYMEVAEKLAARFGLKKVAITLRESLSASDNIWGAMYYDGSDYHFSRKYPVHIVDRVGSGDSFGAGLIYSLLEGAASCAAVEFAAAASCLQHSVEGDFNLVSVAEVMGLVKGGGSGRVQR